MNVTVSPMVLRWARERSSLSTDTLAKKLKIPSELVSAWELSGALTVGRLEKLAQKTHTPLGFLFLPEPPEEKLPVPDFRTVPEKTAAHPSPDLLDTLYQCQRQQDWYREYLIEQGGEPLPFVASATMTSKPEDVAHSIRDVLGITNEVRATWRTWEDALRGIIDLTEKAGVLVMRSGVVGNNPHRRLDTEEFRGFVLSDKYAPLIFINAADAKAAQMFSLAHELAHLCLGQSGVSDIRLRSDNSAERYCNKVAAELLVPIAEFRTVWAELADRTEEVQRLARHFKVSPLVILIRAFDAGALVEKEFVQLYGEEMERIQARKKGARGNFYRTQGSRYGKRFARAVIASTLEGKTQFRDAFRLLGLKKVATFHELARTMGILV